MAILTFWPLKIHFIVEVSSKVVYMLLHWRHRARSWQIYTKKTNHVTVTSYPCSLTEVVSNRLRVTSSICISSTILGLASKILSLEMDFSPLIYCQPFSCLGPALELNVFLRNQPISQNLGLTLFENSYLKSTGLWPELAVL